MARESPGTRVSGFLVCGFSHFGVLVNNALVRPSPMTRPPATAAGDTDIDHRPESTINPQDVIRRRLAAGSDRRRVHLVPYRPEVKGCQAVNLLDTTVFRKSTPLEQLDAVGGDHAACRSEM
jgi:hypothetical protein